MSDRFSKDPNATLDFVFDWSAWLEDTETITSHEITAAEGIVVDSSTEAAGKITVWLSGGTESHDYRVACKIVTSSGRTDERTMTIVCHDR